MSRLPPSKLPLYLGASPSRASAYGKDRTPLSHNLTMTALSDVGRVRKRNEDSFCLAPDLGVAVVADGMGGHPGGDVASRIAAEVAVRRLRTLLPTPDGHPSEGIVEALRAAMAQSVLGAHHAIRHEGVRNPSLDGMGTTLTALAACAETRILAVGHVGDSRAYRLRDGELERLTRDDTWVQRQVDQAALTIEQARRHPFGHILTQCLGLAEPPEPQVLLDRVEPGDLYLLCTDGLVGMLEDAEIAAILRQAAESDNPADALKVVAEALVVLAKERGGFDNITVALAAADR